MGVCSPLLGCPAELTSLWAPIGSIESSRRGRVKWASSPRRRAIDPLTGTYISSAPLLAFPSDAEQRVRTRECSPTTQCPWKVPVRSDARSGMAAEWAPRCATSDDRRPRTPRKAPPPVQRRAAMDGRCASARGDRRSHYLSGGNAQEPTSGEGRKGGAEAVATKRRVGNAGRRCGKTVVDAHDEGANIRF